MPISQKRKLSYREAWGHFNWETVEHPLEIIQFMEGTNADINARDTDNATILLKLLENYNTSKTGCKKAIEWLIDNGANIEVQTQRNQYTALFLAVAKNDPDIVKKLLKRKANPNIVSIDGWPGASAPLLKAQDLEMVNLLCSNGADPNFPLRKKENNDGTVIQITVMSEWIQSYANLFKKKTQKENEVKKYKQILLALLRNGANIETLSSIQRITLLSHAVQNFDIPLALELVKMGAKTDTPEIQATVQQLKETEPDYYKILKDTLNTGIEVSSIPRANLRTMLRNASTKQEQRNISALLAQDLPIRKEVSDKLHAQRQARDSYELTKKKLFHRS